MRIVAGKFKGHRLSAPSGMATRPTTDRTRESIFNILSNCLCFDGIRVLDLFAGSGAMGLEALSRGASFCLFVDNNARARAAIRQNTENLKATGATKIFRRDATSLGPVGTMRPFDLALIDPPYRQALGPQAVTSLLEGGWLVDNATIVLEEHHEGFPRHIDGLELLDERRYADTGVGFFRKTKFEIHE